MLEYYITPLLNCQHFFSPFLFAFFNYSGCFAESGIFIGFIVMLWRECFIEVGVLLGYWFITLLLLYLWFCCFYFLSRLRCSRVGAESGTMWASSPTGGVMISCVFKRENTGSSNRAIDFLMFLRTAARAVPTICFSICSGRCPHRPKVIYFIIRLRRIGSSGRRTIRILSKPCIFSER